MTPEKKILESIVRYLTKLRDEGEPVFWFKVHGGPMQQAGIPDLIVCYRGRFVALEVKGPDGRATGLQKHTLGKIVGAWGVGAVVRSVEQVKEVLSDVGERA